MDDRLEYELGVLLPGLLQPEHRWTRTLYPDPGTPFDWDRVFGRRAVRIVDLGCGSGRFLLGSAVAHPGRDHLGIEVVDRLALEATRRADRRGLANVRIAAGDAVRWIFERLGEDSVDEIHIYHPQPYYNPAERGQRMLTPEFFDRLWRILRKDGCLILQTDHRRYGKYLLEAAAKYFELELHADPWPGQPEGRTRREIIARRKGMTIRRVTARRRSRPLPVEIPRIDFDTRRGSPRLRRAPGPSGSGRPRSHP